MDVHGFLSRRHTSLPIFGQSVQSALGLTEDDVVILGGSLVDGIGTSSSDIDLILLTDRDDIDFNACLTDVAVVVGDALADIRVIAFADLERLLRRFEVWANSPRIPRRAFEFTTDERKLLYRISTGMLLHGPSSYGARIRAAVSESDLARHKLDSARHLGSTYLIDLQGLFADGRYVEMIPIAQELCNQAVDAMLCGWGVTNPNGKWRMRYLSQLPPDWNSQMPNVMSPRSATDAVLDIGRPPSQYDPERIIGFVSRICAFARMAFLWAEDAVLCGERTTSRWQSHRTGETTDRGLKIPVLHFDVDITVEDETAWITRLNQPGLPEPVPAEVLAVLVWADGVTTAEQLQHSPASISKALQFISVGDYAAALPRDRGLLDEVLGRSLLDR